mmetsp:Transcript_64388/g.94277  ORF Transcript_64388/g.94277 Transcript_64388/m.94277 type:complete len:727 (+) Transcript_64388:235-2415(+)
MTTTFVLRVLLGVTLGATLCGHCSCDEQPAGRSQGAEVNEDAQLKLRDDYVKALEDRISRLERVLDGSRSQGGGLHGRSDPSPELESRARIQPISRDVLPHAHTTTRLASPTHGQALAQNRVESVRERDGAFTEEGAGSNGREAAIWRRARNAVRDSSATLGQGSELSSAGSKVRQAGSSEAYDVRIMTLEASMQRLDLMNVTSIANDIERIKVEIGNTFDAGDTAWVMVCTSLVLLMTIPGLALFYGGLVRVQNVLSTVMQSFSIACLITVEWMMVGYSLSFTKGNVIFGDSSRFWLRGLNMTSRHPLMPTVPEPIFCMFQLTFAIITPALICGSFADRLKFGPMLVFMGLWHLVVYCPLSHAMWTENGFLHRAHVLDFAGGNVVHVAAGFSGLVCSIVVGKRANFGRENFHPHNILISVLGAALLWVGWMGFNGGTAGRAGAQAALACLNSQISAATGSLSWMTTEWLIRKRPSVLGIISGALAGLVCITPGAGYVDTTGAFVSGLLAGPTCFAACQLKHIFKFDDALDAFGIHGPAGVLGGILTGFFSKKSLTAGVFEGTAGVFEGNAMQLPLQLYGIAVSIGWSMLGTGILLKLIDLTLGLRVGIDDELLGLDLACHGESVFPQGTEPRSDKSYPRDTSCKSCRPDISRDTSVRSHRHDLSDKSCPHVNTSAGGVFATDWHEGIGQQALDNSNRAPNETMRLSREEPAANVSYTDNVSYGVA